MKWIDAALAAAAIGLTACTVVLCAEDDRRAPPAPVAGILHRKPLIILHGRIDGLVCPTAAAAAHEPSKTGDLHITIDRPERRTLVAALAHLCRQMRMDPEQIITHRDLDPTCPCGCALRPGELIGEIRREMMR